MEENIRLGKKYYSDFHIIDNFKTCRVCKGDILEEDWDNGLIQCRKCLTSYEILICAKYILKKIKK
jgi:reverse gyrase